MYHIKVKRWEDADEWEPTMFPKCANSLDELREQAEDLTYLYRAVGIFDSDNELHETLRR